MTAHANFWKERLEVPAYSVRDAARYAKTTRQTIYNWQKIGAGLLAKHDRGQSLSYMQLIELGVVAAMRRAGLKLSPIQKARDYLAREIGSKHPFAEYRFKRYGQQILVDGEQISKGDKDKLIAVSNDGQLVWKEIMERLLQEFDYPKHGPVVGWNVAGRDEPIRIDPRIAFGEPQVSGIPTWVLRDRWNSGENLSDITSDYDLDIDSVLSALKFEGVEIDYERPSQWHN